MISGKVEITRHIKGKWVIEITDGECCKIPTTDVWLYHKDYATKMLCFGEEGKVNHEQFDIIKILEDNKEFYKKEYMDYKTTMIKNNN